jgi:hypothetical protein
VRAELVLDEHVAARAGEPIRLPAPSSSTPDFTLRRLLRAVLDRPLRPDPHTSLELRATT